MRNPPIQLPEFGSAETGPEPFVSERDAASFLGVSVRTMQRWRTEPPTRGAIRYYKLGAKRVVYRLSDLALWAEAQVLNSTSEMSAA